MGLCASKPKEDEEAMVFPEEPRSDGLLQELWVFDDLDTELEGERWQETYVYSWPVLAFLLMLLGVAKLVLLVLWDVGVFPDIPYVERGDFYMHPYPGMHMVDWALVLTVLSLGTSMAVHVLKWVSDPVPYDEKGIIPPPLIVPVNRALAAVALPFSFCAAIVFWLFQATLPDDATLPAAYSVSLTPFVLNLIAWALSNHQRHLRDIYITNLVFIVFIVFVVIYSYTTGSPSEPAAAAPAEAPEEARRLAELEPLYHTYLLGPIEWPYWVVVVLVAFLDTLWLFVWTNNRRYTDEVARERIRGLKAELVEKKKWGWW